MLHSNLLKKRTVFVKWKKKFIAERFPFSKFFNDLSVYVLFRGPIGFRYLCCLQAGMRSRSMYYCIYLSLLLFICPSKVQSPFSILSLHHTTISALLAISPSGMRSPLSINHISPLNLWSPLYMLSLHHTPIIVHLPWNLLYISPWDLWSQFFSWLSSTSTILSSISLLHKNLLP
jgi:hypothetical protein